MNYQDHFSGLLDIYERFGDNAQKALDFVKKNIAMQECSIFNTSVSDNRISDGVYYILKDGTYIQSSENCDSDDVQAIGIAHDGHYFAVPLDGNYGESRLLKNDKYPEDDYCQKEIDAIMDWDFVKHTNHLKELGLAIDLKEGHYLPVAPVWGAMYKNREALNKALKHVCADEIDFSDCFWFAQRYYVNNAWYFYGYDGSLNYTNVSNTSRAQAVALWDPKA